MLSGAEVRKRWRELSSASCDQSASETARGALLRDLAARDPEEAIRLASLETNWRRRGIFIRAALHGWAKVAPQAAIDWMLSHVREGERHEAVEEIIAGAIARPDEAVRVIEGLCAQDVSMGSDYGNMLVVELTRVGEFDSAVQFAASGPAEWRNHWLGTAYFQWAQSQPEAAIAGVQEIPDAATRVEAWQGAVSGWAASDPATLVNYAARLPSGEARSAAMREGLQRWVTIDPVAAAQWMTHLDAGEEFDVGAAAVATVKELVATKPNVAIQWAKSIGDADRRSSTLADVIREWAAQDPIAARRYAAASPDLRPGDRVSLLEDFAATASQTP
jgi:hypothetical protein